MKIANQRSARLAARSPCWARHGALVALVALVGVVAAALPRPASAQPVVAEALFQEGRRLLKEGRLDEACGKLAESHRLDPSSGTLLNLADCHEQQGKTASAWAEFLAASRLAQAQNNGKRLEEARRRASALASKLSSLTVMTPPQAGLTVWRDGEPLSDAQLGTKLPIDPGAHVIEAKVNGYVPFRTNVVVGPERDDVQVVVPTLPPASAPTPAPRPDAGSRPPAGARRARSTERGAPGRSPLGYVVGGAGLAAAGAGALFGVLALGTYDRASSDCSQPPNGCSVDAVKKKQQADNEAWVANVGIGLGVVGVAVGAYLLFVSPARPARPSGPKAQAGLTWAPAPGGVVLRF